jgi:maltooligosyltrehalose trehalohydrolase
MADRIGRSLSLEQLELAAAPVVCAPFVPMLFQGEEWNASTPFQYFTDHQDAALAARVREGRRREFAAHGHAPEAVPDPQAPASFEACRLDWAEQSLPEHRRVLEWYRALVQLRRREPALRSSEVPLVETWASAAGHGCLQFQRGPLIVVANLSSAAVRVPLAGGATLLLASAQASITGCELGLPAWGVGILRTNDSKSG